MKFPGMASGGESDEYPHSSHAHAHNSLVDEQASTHARTQDRLPHLQFPTWTFPASRSPSITDPPRSATATIFSPQPRSHQGHPSNSDPELAAPSHAHDRAHSTSHAGLFNNPNRSIFSSGPPIASVSSSTAQASMSYPPPPQPPHPLSALNNPPGNSGKRSVHYQNNGPPSHRKSRISRAEKDIDDPSATHERAPSADGRGVSTPTALTRLFAAPEATPILSRNASYIRTHSGTAYTRASSNTAPLPNHLYNQGLLGGKHSDITVHAFGTSYALHRLLLDRAPFFSSALSEPWFEASSKDMTLHPEDIDSNITQPAFELALKRIYGSHATSEEDKEAIGLFATGCWLEMPDLIDASVASILRQMSTAKLGSLIKLVTGNYYGKHGDRILGSAKAMLCREGWEMPLRYWDEVSGEIAREIIGGDGFFIPGEWERFIIAKKVLDRKLRTKAMDAGLFEPNGRPQRVPPDAMAFQAVRFDSVYRRTSFSGRVPEVYDQWLTLYTSPDIASLLVLLDEGIHYVHLSFEQLQKIREQRDILGLPLMSDKVINDALWMQMELRQKVVNAPELDLEIGLSRPAEEASDEVMADDSNNRNALFNNKGKQRDTSNDGDDNDNDDDGFDVEMESGSWDGNGKPRKFWIPNTDSTSVMGGSPDTALYATPSTNRPYVSRLSASIDPVDVQWASDFTASANERPTVTDRNEQNPPISYTNYPPFRFAAEFPNPRNLKEKKRVYSRTVWYAGSLWNVYIQKVETTKNTQLGVYLHRAKDKEAHEEHHRGSVDERISQVEGLMERNRRRHRRNSEEEIGNSSADPDATLVPPEQTSRSTTLSNLLRGHPPGNSSEPSSLTKSSQTPTTPGPHTFSQHSLQGPNSDSDLDDPALNSRESTKTQNSVPTIPAYVDGRPTIKTYFKIYSPSKGGRMLSVYESAPDLFNFSQSWGWKSSTMVLDDGLCGFDGVGEGASTTTGTRSKEGRLRFMVVIGNV